MIQHIQNNMNDGIHMETKRLILRNVSFLDIESLIEYANDYHVIEMMNGSMPFPYTKIQAEEWLSKHIKDSSYSQSISWIIASRENAFMGSIQLRMDEKREFARLSYWLGRQFWNKGFTTEAVEKVIRYGFEELQLEKIEAEVFKRNIHSGSILHKVGFNFEGSIQKIDKFANRLEDFDQFMLNRSNYSNKSAIL